ncbi:MAG TPA: hypothetical protein PLD23_08165 [Armatimonadota bacterium]|nr:hypothetical protein [Armatimonadota bacterium]HQK93467.1 hypothetical protein [Armatimonadota bacterium]
MNRVLAILSAGVLVLSGAEYLSGPPSSGQWAVQRLILPALAYGTLMGVTGVPRAWLWTGLGAALYVSAQSVGVLLDFGIPVDATRFLVVPVTSLFAAFGQSIARQRREARVLREVAERLLSARWNPGTLARRSAAVPGVDALDLDTSVLTEGGLIASVLAEDRRASSSSRVSCYVLAAILIVLYLMTQSLLLLGMGLGVFVVTALSLLWTTLTRATSPFDALVAGYFELAAVGFGTALRAHPLDVKSRIGLGLALLHLRRIDQAVHELSTARRIGLHRFSIAVWVGIERVLAVAAYEKGDHNRAIRAFESVLALYPDHAPTLYYTGLAHAASGRRRMARDLLGRAAALGYDEAARALATLPEQPPRREARPAPDAVIEEPA